MTSSIRIRPTALAIALALALPCLPAAAQIADTGDGGGTAFTGSIGVGAVWAPEFEGSDKSEAKPMPFLNLRYGPVFLSSDKGLGVRFDLLDGALEISPAFNYRFGRDAGDSDLLHGMGDVQGQLTAGGSITYRIDDISFMIKGFQGLSDEKGFTMDMRLGYLNRYSEQLHWGLSAEAGFADSEYNQTYFGVNHEQSERSGYKVFSPSGGLKDIAFGGSLDYYLTPSFSAGAFAKFTRISGDPSDSPIVQKGSPNQFATGILFFYHFGTY
jgi:outer membrane scaffolding protein for murein synthesis (MipA/OmpV family)